MDFWRSYQTPDTLTGQPQIRWLEFNGRQDDNRLRPQGESVFGAAPDLDGARRV
jgi:hypothetical protein